MPKRSIFYWVNYYGFEAFAKTADLAVAALLFSWMLRVENPAQTVAIWFCLLAVRSLVEVVKNRSIDDKLLSMIASDAECVFDLSLVMLLPAMFFIWILGVEDPITRIEYWYWPAGVFSGLFVTAHLTHGLYVFVSQKDDDREFERQRDSIST